MGGTYTDVTGLPKSHTFSIPSPGCATDTTDQTPVITFAHPISENVALVVLSKNATRHSVFSGGARQSSQAPN
jgi:hypothetical protein